MDRSAFTNVARIRRLVQESELAAIVVTSSENITYFSGFYDMDIPQLKGTHFVVWPSDGEAVLVTHSRGPGFGGIDAFLPDIRVYDSNYLWQEDWGRPGPRPAQILADVLIEKGLSRAKIGLEMRFVSVPLFTELKSFLPHVEFVDCTTLSEMARIVKTPAEIEHFHWAARVTDRAITVTYEMARPGDTEKDIADLLGYNITRFGADTVKFNVVASGERITLGHHFAEREALKSGDLFRVDYGGLFAGYTTDMVRMAVVGRPSERQRTIYQKMIELQKRMVERVRPGVVPSELVQTAWQEYEEMGLPPDREVFGHCIGLDIHERPIWTIKEDLPLEKDMVICIENGWMDQAANERYHIEDMYAVTNDGARLLTDYSSIDEMHVME
jgi:Xaa-Pro aminopeptidase